jgi:hypothetical protein
LASHEAKFKELGKQEEVIRCKWAANLVFKFHNILPQTQKHIELANNVLAHGVLSQARAAKKNLLVVPSADKSIVLSQNIHFNIILNNKDTISESIVDSLLSRSRGGLSVALELKKDPLKPFIPTVLDLTEAQKKLKEVKKAILEAREAKTDNDSNIEYLTALKFDTLDKCLNFLAYSKGQTFLPFDEKAIKVLNNRLQNTVLIVTSFKSMKNNLEDEKGNTIQSKIGQKLSEELSKNEYEQAADEDAKRLIGSKELIIQGSLKPEALEWIIVPNHLEKFKNFIIPDKRTLFIDEQINIVASDLHYLNQPIRLKHPNYEPILKKIFSNDSVHQLTHMMRCLVIEE